MAHANGCSYKHTLGDFCIAPQATIRYDGGQTIHMGDVVNLDRRRYHFNSHSMVKSVCSSHLLLELNFKLLNQVITLRFNLILPGEQLAAQLGALILQFAPPSLS